MNKNWQIKYESDRLIQHAGLNCRYYQYMSYWWYLVDRLLKFILAVGAVLGLVVDEGSTKWLSVSLIALSIALNVVPSDAREAFYSLLFKRWAKARELAEVIHLKTKYLPNDNEEPKDPKLVAEIEKLAKSIQEIHRDEILPMRWLIIKCEQQERQMWGIGSLSNGSLDQEVAGKGSVGPDHSGYAQADSAGATAPVVAREILVEQAEDEAEDEAEGPAADSA